MNRAVRTALHAAWVASTAKRWRAFEAALEDPDAHQRELLRRHLRAQAGTVYGRRHTYAEIATLEQFQDRVPVVTFDDLADDVARAAAGEPQVLTAEPIRLFERSSGSSAASKLIPFTDGLKAQFDAATAPWLGSLHARWPGVVGGRAYWSVSPVARAPETTPGGHRIGIDDDAEYLGPVARVAARALVAVPSTVAHAPTMDAWRRETLRHLLEAEDLTLLSVWSPSFLTVLLRHLERDWHSVLAALSGRRRRRLEASVRRQGFTARALWPRLAVISCWTDAAARAAVRELRKLAPDIPIQPKGLLATEGVVTLPWMPRRARRPVGHADLGPMVPTERLAAVTSHVLELVDLDRPDARPVLPGQVREGGRYQPLLTTAGGLTRYALGDELVCTGFVRRTPTLVFVGKRDAVSDLVGEKLSAGHARTVLDAAAGVLAAPPRYAMLVPVPEPRPDAPPTYALVIDAADGADPRLGRYARAVAAGLADNPHYAYARDLGQLDPLQVACVPDAAAWYLDASVARGQRAGDVKPTPLAVGWTQTPPGLRPLSSVLGDHP